jgi:hypothetical protein
MAKKQDDDFFDEVPIFVGVLNDRSWWDLLKQYREHVRS